MSDKLRYVELRNKVTNIHRISKRAYIAKKIRLYTNYLRKTWGVLNEILGKKKSRTLLSYVMRGNMKLTDDKSIADSFNNYFSEIGNDISPTVRGTSMQFSQYLPEKTIIHSLSLEPTCKRK